ncbi:AlpA family transcriptional regulator [Cognaticolwellia mytili]|uniref:AlpA family transcriptional regulator n=1 Tax=Cognaticolwellia mytili TaxID=1888913 RepID=UPI000A171370|nr:AlpA family transcriptional regulator [Cognaticolwellia mytili]
MRLIKLKEVMHLTALGRSSIYKMMEEESFPKSINLGIRSVAWIEGDILEWIEEKIANNQ